MRMIGQKECREIQMAILDEIERICKVNNLTYSLAYGTLLGAVRHKGYIPWDDDIDICLLREDYEKLIAILKDKNAPGSKEWLTLVDDTCDGYFYPFAKAYDNRTTVKLMRILKDSSTAKPEWLSLVDDTSKGYYYPFAKAIDNRTEVRMDRHTGNDGIWVDIFPLDGLPASKIGSKLFILFCGLLRVIQLAMDTDFSSKTLSFGTLLYKRFFYIFATVVGKKRICRFVEKVFHLFDIDKSKNVTVLFFDSKCDTILDKEKLLPMATLPFENREYACFANYDYYLKELYNDYMTLPPEEKRWTHDFDAWWKE